MHKLRLECSDPETSDCPIAADVLLRQEPEEEEEEDEGDGKEDNEDEDDEDDEDDDGYSE